LTADPAGGAAVPATAGLAVPLSVELLDLGAEPERRMRTLDRGLQPTVGRELVNPRQRDAEPGVQINNVAAAQNADGRLEVFGTDNGRNVQHVWQTTPNNGCSGPWVQLGTPGPTSVNGQEWLVGAFSVAAGRNTGGELEVFVQGGAPGPVFHLWQRFPGRLWNNSEGGTDWELLYDA
jgi:hypothetical protein